LLNHCVTFLTRIFHTIKYIFIKFNIFLLILYINFPLFLTFLTICILTQDKKIHQHKFNNFTYFKNFNEYLHHFKESILLFEKIYFEFISRFL
jgi:hypothetical protein